MHSRRFIRRNITSYLFYDVLVFCAPVGKTSWINVIWLFVFIMFYYLSITTYCTPYNALVPELGHDQKERLDISTAISLTFIVGTAFAYAAPVIWGALEGSMGRVVAMRVTFSILAVIAFICMLVPVFAIKEKEYVQSKPAEGPALSSLIKTFRNRGFRIFVGSDIFYWIALTMFQTGLPFFVTSLLELPENMSTAYFVAMTALSLVFYIPVNMLTRRFGKKRLVVIAFTMFAAAFGYTACMGSAIGIPSAVQGFILVVVAAFPMAVFGILPQAMVADISEYDSRKTGENREGMFSRHVHLRSKWDKVSLCCCLPRSLPLEAAAEPDTVLLLQCQQFWLCQAGLFCYFIMKQN